MDIFTFAMQMEKDGELFYRDLTNKTDNKGIKAILTLLADAEVNHYQILEKMSREADGLILTKDTIFQNVKNIFQQMKDDKDAVNISSDASYVGLYKDALDIESKSKSFYLEKADEVSGQAQKEILLQLAEEEKKHMVLVNTIIEFISRPATWLENAEWYHLDEY
jgi:rubrerythrin